MANPLSRALALAPLLWLLTSPLAAQLLPLGPPAEVSASYGLFDGLREGDGLEAGWEVRYPARRFRLLPSWVPEVIPVAGATASSRGILYGYGGVRLDLPVGERWRLSPGWATGIYYSGHGKKLGGALEFRSHIELSYGLRNGSRVGLCLYHLSNAGIFDFNPGSESLLLTYSADLRRFPGR